MKKTTLIALLTVFLIFNFTNLAAGDTTAINLTVSDRGIGFSLMQQTASSFFAINYSEFRPYQPATNPVEIFPVLYLAGETGYSPEHIRQKHQGRGWGRTTKEMGLPANYHGKYMSAKHRHKYTEISVMDDYAFEEMMAVRFLCDYYGTDSELLFYWHSRGLSYQDLFLAVNLGARLRRPAREFFELRLSGRDWRYVAHKYQISYDSLSRPEPPVRKFSRQVKMKNDFDQDDKGKRHGRKH
jgi:hypothetical protein